MLQISSITDVIKQLYLGFMFRGSIDIEYGDLVL